MGSRFSRFNLGMLAIAVAGALVPSASGSWAHQTQLSLSKGSRSCDPQKPR